MLRSLYTGASGMNAQQLNIDNISNNLANVNTSGYKKTSVEFQDLLYHKIRTVGTKTGAESETPTELQVGSGVKPVATNRNFSQGSLVHTNNPLDLAINGDGFFIITKDNGETGYTRDGHFKLSAEGTIVTNDGYIVEPQITIPGDTKALMIGDNGVVSIILPGDNTPVEVGQFELAKFINNGGLKATGKNIYEQTSASGEAITGTPFSVGFGTTVQGHIEASNVDLVNEMVSMITAQRAYELNSKSINTSDSMLRTANGLKRS